VATYEGINLVVENCVFTGNTSTTHGGAVANFAGTASYIDCVFTDNQANQGGGAAGPLCGSLDFTSCVFAGNTATMEGGAIYLNDVTSSEWRNCTIVGSASPVGSGVFIEKNEQDPVMIWNTIIAGGVGGAGLEWDGMGVVFLGCCDLFGNQGGDWTGAIASQEAYNGNMSLDPGFCDGVPGADPWGLDVSSPCSGDNSACGGAGARGVVCDGMVGNEDGPAPAPATALRLHPCRPNPFNPATVVAFDIDAPGMVSLDVVDVRGRHVARLVSGALGAGAHEATWRGRDDAGVAAPAGVYFAKLVVGETREMRRMTLLK